MYSNLKILLSYTRVRMCQLTPSKMVLQSRHFQNGHVQSEKRNQIKTITTEAKECGP
ncbi:hypothetical protein DMN91_005972, partial [Ooceraea biroi]